MTGVWLLAALGLAIGSEAGQVEVLGDRVNLRARPRAEAEVAGQVHTGTILESRGEEGDWIQVAAPPDIGLWVIESYVKDGRVVPRRLNVRAGAGINYPAVGMMNQGDPVTVRKKVGEWLEIAPPPSATLWISRTLVRERPAPAPAVAKTPPPAPPAPPVAARRAPVPPPPVPPPNLGGGELVPLDGQGEILEREGVLRRSSLWDIRRGGGYCLTDRVRGRPVTVCYIRGNEAQLKTLEGRRIRVKGNAYWVKGGAKPILVPRQIMPLPDAP
mgnify:CR=1 FL=1